MIEANLDSVRSQIDVIRWIRTRRKELDDLEAMARAAIEEALGGSEVGTLDGKPAVRWTTFKRRNLDTKALKESLPEVYEQFVKASEVRRFEVLKEDQ